jgi:hypothetical protein
MFHMTETRAAGVASHVARITGLDVLQLISLEPAGSFVPNHHYRAKLADGATAFVKEAASAWTVDMLRSERAAYETLGSQPYLPTYLGGNENILIVEDLGSARWPPPWRRDDLPHVLETLAEIAATPAPSELRDLNTDGLLHCWGHVAEKPDAFLGLGICTSQWFDEVAHALVATDTTPLAGDALVHGDFRGDNAALLDRRCIAVDWAAAARGRGDFDRTAFAVSYAVETGELPEQVAPEADPELVAVLAGPLARFANDRSVPSRVRTQLTNQLQVAIPWWTRITGFAAL